MDLLEHNDSGADGLKTGEAKFRSLFNAMTEGVAIHELVRNANGEAEDYRIIDTNPAYSRQTGVDRDRAKGALASELYGAVGAPYLEVYSQVVETGVSTSFETHFEPLCRHFRISAFSMGQDIFGTVFEDITERKRAEEALRESEEHFRLLTEYSPVPIGVTSRTGQVEYVNDRLAELFGYAREEIPTVDVWWTKAYPDPEYRREVLETWQESGGMGESGDVDPHEYRVTCKDGSVRTVEVSGAHIGGRDLIIFNDITERKRSEKAIKDYSERLEEMVAERTAELQRTQEELFRKERLATLGQFAGSVGHELRNPLGVISNAVYYLQAVIENPDATTREYLEMIAKEVRNSEKIIYDLLEISRNRPPEKQSVSVGELVREALAHQPSWEGGEVHTELPENLPAVYVDSRQMVQVIVNLTTNAVQAMPDGGCLTLAARQVGGTVLLDVIDTGMGMSRELMDKVFDPLVTTKPRGIGLGLTLSRRLTELNGARLEVESEEGKGSRFRIIFPPAHQEACPTQ